MFRVNKDNKNKMGITCLDPMCFYLKNIRQRIAFVEHQNGCFLKQFFFPETRSKFECYN